MKKLIIALLVVCMVASLGMAAFAADPQTTEPQTTNPQTTDPQTTDPQTTDPKTTDPQTTDPQTTDPQTTEPEFVFPFEDVKEDYWGYKEVYWAAENGVTNGITKTQFGPENACTRAMVVTMIWRQEKSPEPTIDKVPFTDLDKDQYYYKAVLWAYENKVTKGTSDTTFSPNEPVTRGQFVTLLARNADKDEAVTSTPFTDVDVNAYYAGAVKWAAENGITNGRTPKTFAPEENCKRAEVVTFLYRFYVTPLAVAEK